MQGMCNCYFCRGPLWYEIGTVDLKWSKPKLEVGSDFVKEAAHLDCLEQAQRIFEEQRRPAAGQRRIGDDLAERPTSSPGDSQ